MIKVMLAQLGGDNFSKFKFVWWIGQKISLYGRNSKKIQKKIFTF